MADAVVRGAREGIVKCGRRRRSDWYLRLAVLHRRRLRRTGGRVAVCGARRAVRLAVDRRRRGCRRVRNRRLLLARVYTIITS